VDTIRSVAQLIILQFVHVRKKWLEIHSSNAKPNVILLIHAIHLHVHKMAFVESSMELPHVHTLNVFKTRTVLQLKHVSIKNAEIPVKQHVD
jgi:hypothetical protein